MGCWRVNEPDDVRLLTVHMGPYLACRQYRCGSKWQQFVEREGEGWVVLLG